MARAMAGPAARRPSGDCRRGRGRRTVLAAFGVYAATGVERAHNNQRSDERADGSVSDSRADDGRSTHDRLGSDGRSGSPHARLGTYGGHSTRHWLGIYGGHSTHDWLGTYPGSGSTPRRSGRTYARDAGRGR